MHTKEVAKKKAEDLKAKQELDRKMSEQKRILEEEKAKKDKRI